MWKFLAPPAYKAEMPAEKVDSNYKKLRWQVFLGIFIGYAGFFHGHTGACTVRL